MLLGTFTIKSIIIPYLGFELSFLYDRSLSLGATMWSVLLQPPGFSQLVLQLAVVVSKNLRECWPYFCGHKEVHDLQV